jgi:hypothetical protein
MFVASAVTTSIPEILIHAGAGEKGRIVNRYISSNREDLTTGYGILVGQWVRNILYYNHRNHLQKFLHFSGIVLRTMKSSTRWSRAMGK